MQGGNVNRIQGLLLIYIL